MADLTTIRRVSTGNHRGSCPSSCAGSCPPLNPMECERLYINEGQHFSPVPENVWEFYIGGYQVLDKYLKSRKGHTLTLPEIENIQDMVKALAFTIEQMQRIDEIWKP